MTVVVDASITVAWFFPDECNDAIDEVMSRLAAEGGTVPPHWPAEVANAFLMAVRRKRIDPAYRGECLEKLATFDIAPDDDSNGWMWSATLRLADIHRLTIYDAAYLELAQRRRMPLATLDAALARAARASGVDVLG
ncbi:type II toxin-antitoxin system VapC family toxin [Methylosinus sp. H3A]|uniref:type II toxin-antitoxin system VapC family toxin n=1 Tax=Methylosinus sp. H3A TaxID=2785786 RepID=UPI0018C34966|nr:type II toxin-antitoxin system VapC family toxin [Methylosinus sp. H3A]MBG0810070.1 type II toxin-antitoxin system VapC family toxin [Methylosinus sp. H3A]